MSAQAEAARSLVRVGRHGEAVKLLLQALASSPDDDELHCLLAQAHIGARQPAEALRAADNAARLAPDDEWPHRLRSIALRRLGKGRDAVAAAAQAVRLSPELAYARHALAEAHLAAKQVDEAYAQAYEARRLSPEDADMYDLLGRCLLARKMPKEAEASFRQALQLDPTDAAAHNNLGVALQRQGRSVEAVHAYNDAARIDPSFETARQNLYSATRVLIGGGSAVFLGYLLFRVLVGVSVTHGSSWFALVALAVVAIGIAVWIRRYRPFTRKNIPPTAIAYYKAERKRLRRINRPYLLLRLATIPLAAGMLVVAAMLNSTVLLLLVLPLAIAWYWGTPRLWRRYVQRGA